MFFLSRVDTEQRWQVIAKIRFAKLNTTSVNVRESLNIHRGLRKKRHDSFVHKFRGSDCAFPLSKIPSSLSDKRLCQFAGRVDLCRNTRTTASNRQVSKAFSVSRHNSQSRTTTRLNGRTE